MYLPCGCSILYLCANCGHCYGHEHLYYYDCTRDEWVWMCRTDGRTRRAKFEDEEVQRAKAIELGFIDDFDDPAR